MNLNTLFSNTPTFFILALWRFSLCLKFWNQILRNNPSQSHLGSGTLIFGWFKHKKWQKTKVWPNCIRQHHPSPAARNLWLGLNGIGDASVIDFSAFLFGHLRGRWVHSEKGQAWCKWTTWGRSWSYKPWFLTPIRSHKTQQLWLYMSRNQDERGLAVGRGPVLALTKMTSECHEIKVGAIDLWTWKRNVAPPFLKLNFDDWISLVHLTSAAKWGSRVNHTNPGWHGRSNNFCRVPLSENRNCESNRLGLTIGSLKPYSPTDPTGVETAPSCGNG